MPSPDPVAVPGGTPPSDLHAIVEAAFQRAALGMAVVDSSRRPVAVNDAMLAMFGYSAEEMREMDFARLTHPDDLALDTHLFAELREGVRDRFQVDKRYVRRDGSAFWGRVTISRLDAGVGSGGYMVGVIEDITVDRRIQRDQEFLIRAGVILASSLDFDTALAEVTQLASTYLADWCAIDELGPDGKVRRISVAHPDPAKVALAHELAERYPPDADAERGLLAVLRTGKPELVEEIPDEWLVEGAVDEEHLRVVRELGLHSYIIVPLIARGAVLGALSLVSAESGRRYGPDDLALAEELARRASVALDNARLFGEAEAARRAAEAAERGVRDILDGIGDPFVVQDRDWRYRYINDAAADVFRKAGRDPDALLGTPLWDAYPDLVGTRHEAEMRRAQRERVTVSFEEYYAGAGTWSEMRCYPLADGGLATAWKDITERKQAEEALHYLAESSMLLGSMVDYEETLRAVARLMVPELADWCAVDILDEGGKLRQVAVAHVDPAKVKWAEELNQRYPPDPAASTGAYEVLRTGRPEIYPEVPDEMLAATAVDEEHLRIARELGLRSAIIVPLKASRHTVGVLTLVSAESGRRYTEADLALAMELARRAGLAVENAHLYRETDEARLRLEEQAIEMEMQGEELRTQAAQLEEIQTDLEESNEELHATNDRLVEQMARIESLRTQAEDANRAKSDFLAIMSHELRTPLNAMIGYVDLLLAGIPEPIPALAHAQVVRMRGAARHLLQLIEEVLTFSRLEAGREAAEVQEVNLDELLGEVGAIIEPLAASKHVAFRFPLHVDQESIRTDPRKLRQILINVLGNAVKFTMEGEVCFEVETDDEQICFRVRDTGVGIAPADQEVIFEPFRQLDQGKTRGAEGTGLGLAVSRRLAVLLGGELTVESEAGAGSTFLLCLPLQLPAE